MLAACLGLATLLGACAGTTNDETAFDRAIETDRLRAMLEKRGDEILVLDVRNQEDWEAGRIPGARRVSLQDIDEGERPREFQGYEGLVVYGAHRNSTRALALVKRLVRADFDDVYYYDDGFAAWSRVAPVERGPE